MGKKRQKYIVSQLVIHAWSKMKHWGEIEMEVEKSVVKIGNLRKEVVFEGKEGSISQVLFGKWFLRGGAVMEEW